jgi:hypothetical protein
MRIVRPALLLAAALVAGCGHGAGPREPKSATLDVELTHGGRGEYGEGAAWHLRVRGDTLAGTIDAFDGQLLTQDEVTILLPRGRFTITSGQRPCDGNCTLLDAERDRCSRALRVKGDEHFRAVVRLRPGEGCTIDLGG